MVRASSLLVVLIGVSYGLSRGPALIHAFDANVFADGKSSVPSPVGLLQDVRAHELIELIVPHYHGAEGTAGANRRELVQEGGWGCRRADLGGGLAVGDGVKRFFVQLVSRDSMVPWG